MIMNRTEFNIVPIFFVLSLFYTESLLSDQAYIEDYVDGDSLDLEHFSEEIFDFEELDEDKVNYEEISLDGVDYLEDEETGNVYNLEFKHVGKWTENSDEIIWNHDDFRRIHESQCD